MPSAKNKRSKINVDRGVSTRQNLKSEIRKVEKKMNKLLARNANGIKRWKLSRTEKKEIIKLQGFAPESSRHVGMQAHIKTMKSRLKELSETK
jgi:hypothetical protein